MVIRAGSVLAGFLVTFYIARVLGPEANGAYGLLKQSAYMLAGVVLVGTDISVVRHFAPAAGLGIKLRRLTVLRLFAVPLLATSAVFLLLWLTADVLWSPLFGDVIPKSVLPLLLLASIGRIAARLGGSIHRSQEVFALGQSLDALLLPLLIGILLVLADVRQLEALLWIFASLALFVGILALSLSLRLTSSGEGTHDVRVGIMYRTGWPLVGASIGVAFGEWYGLAVAAAMLGSTATGLFQVAGQIAAVSGVVLLGLFAVYATQLARAFHADGVQEFARVVRTMTLMSLIFGLPPTFGLFFLAEPVLAIVGPEFLPAVPALRILLVGQMVVLSCGPAGAALVMMGKERVNLALGIIGLLVLVAAVPLAASLWGLNGLAAAVSIVLAAKRIAAFIIVRLWIRAHLPSPETVPRAKAL